MENSSRVVDRGKRALGVRGVQPPDDARLARTAAEELFLMGMPRVNVLLAGRDEVVSFVLRMLLGQVRKPIATWYPGQRLALPPTGTGTLVLHEVAALGILEQIQLIEWSGGAERRPQLISTTSTLLLPRVRAGAFIDTLYYRLNSVYLDVTGLERNSG